MFFDTEFFRKNIYLEIVFGRVRIDIRTYRAIAITRCDSLLEKISIEPIEKFCTDMYTRDDRTLDLRILTDMSSSDDGRAIVRKYLRDAWRVMSCILKRSSEVICYKHIARLLRIWSGKFHFIIRTERLKDTKRQYPEIVFEWLFFAKYGKIPTWNVCSRSYKFTIFASMLIKPIIQGAFARINIYSCLRFIDHTLGLSFFLAAITDTVLRSRDLYEWLFRDFYGRSHDDILDIFCDLLSLQIHMIERILKCLDGKAKHEIPVDDEHILIFRGREDSKILKPSFLLAFHVLIVSRESLKDHFFIFGKNNL